MESKKYIRIACAVALLLLFSSCLHTGKDNKASRHPNILLIVSEDNGPDLGCYGAQYVKTPVLDSLAAAGVRFDNAYVTYSVCSPSRASIFTGLYPHQNGQIGLATHKYRMYPGIETLPAYLKKAGYRTGCIGKIHVNPESAFPFDFRPSKGTYLLGGNFGRRNLDLYTALADRFFQKSKKPFFLMVNYPDAHTPWKRQVDGMPESPLSGQDIKSPPPFVGANSGRLRRLTADYYNSIDRLDEMIGKLLAKLQASGKAENTLVVYLGDHGPEFSRGKFSSYEAGLKVPLIVSFPGVTKSGSVKKELVSSIDLLPTLLTAAHIKVPENLPGVPLQPLLKGDKKVEWPRKYIFSENEGPFPFAYYPRLTVRGGQFKLIHNLLYRRENPVFRLYATHVINGFEGGSTLDEIAAAGKAVQHAYDTWHHPPEFELYDLKNDPYECDNLSLDSDYNDVKEVLVAELEKWQKETKDPLADPNILRRLTAEVDQVVRTHPKMDDAKDTTFAWKYPEYFLQYIKAQK